jgi:hypothetical protein
MTTRRPLNVNDEDLLCDADTNERPLSDMTAMSYFLQRVRLAEICRCIVDSVPPFSSLSEADYDDILMLDTKLKTFLEELPIFFRLDVDSVEKSREVDEQHPYTPVQRFAICGHAHMKRCRLHQPFLSSHDTRYLYSRNTCLASARAVIQICRQLHEGKVLKAGFASTDRRLLSLIYFLFMATVVLVMDLCFNRQEEQGAYLRGIVTF